MLPDIDGSRERGKGFLEKAAQTDVTDLTSEISSRAALQPEILEDAG